MALIAATEGADRCCQQACWGDQMGGTRTPRSLTSVSGGAGVGHPVGDPLLTCSVIHFIISGLRSAREWLQWETTAVMDSTSLLSAPQIVTRYHAMWPTQRTLLSHPTTPRFPRPVHHRIPNFVNAELAADRLADLPEFKSSKVVKVNPDTPQKMVRFCSDRPQFVKIMCTC